LSLLKISNHKHNHNTHSFTGKVVKSGTLSHYYLTSTEITYTRIEYSITTQIVLLLDTTF